MEAIVAQLGLPYQTISRHFNGLDLELLESLFQTGDIKFFTRFHDFHILWDFLIALRKRKLLFV